MISDITSLAMSYWNGPVTMYKYETYYLNKGYHHIAGTDEAGRGPLAGPLVVAAVILDKDVVIEGLDDSKKLSESSRTRLAKTIKAKAKDYAIIVHSANKVDRLNVYQSAKQAMQEAISALKTCDCVLSDAMPLTLDIHSESIIKGDARSASIAAASILAKDHRDQMMKSLADTYPEYGFDKHKGYGTKAHLEALALHGPTPHHRRSFTPVRNVIDKQIHFNM